MAPESASRAFVGTAKDLADAGQFGEAIKVLQEGLKQYPKLASARVLLGEIYWTSGDAKLARIELEQVTKAVPDNFAAHRKLALVYRELGERESAIRSCQAVLRANSKDHEMLDLLEELQQGSGEAAAPPAGQADSVEEPVASPVAEEGTQRTSGPARRRSPRAKAAPVEHPGEAAPEAVATPSTTLRLSKSPVTAVPSSGGPVAEADAETAEIESETLAELYIVQGHREKGLDVYRRLAAKSPDDPRLRERVETLETSNVTTDAVPQPPAETPAQAKRKAHVRRLEGWLEVIRQRRRA